MNLALLVPPSPPVEAPRTPARPAAGAAAAGCGRRRHVGDLAGRLNDEWALVSVTAAASAAVAGWADTHPVLAGVCSPEELRAGLPALDASGRDAVLLALLERAQDGDRLAGRTVCQAMLPKAVRIAGSLIRGADGGGDGEEALAEAVAALWQAIATYPVQVRRSRVPGNLALTVLALVQRGHVRSSHFGRSAPEVPIADVRTVGVDSQHDSTIDLSTGATPDAELFALLAWAVGAKVLNRAEARLLIRVYDVDADGRPVDGRQVAAQEGVSWPVLRQRCHRLARRLGAAAIAADITTPPASCGSLWPQRAVHRAA